MMAKAEIISQMPVLWTGQRTMLHNSFDHYWETLCDELPANGEFWKIKDATEAIARIYKLSPRTARQYAISVIRYVQTESGSDVITRVGNRYRFT